MLFGEPDNIRNKESSRYYEYWYDSLRIEIGRERYTDGNRTNIIWSLYAYPSNKSYKDILIPEISRYIKPERKKQTVLILNKNNNKEVLVHIIGKRVDEMIWYR